MMIIFMMMISNNNNNNIKKERKRKTLQLVSNFDSFIFHFFFTIKNSIYSD
jgi:hypothetical protein